MTFRFAFFSDAGYQSVRVEVPTFGSLNVRLSRSMFAQLGVRKMWQTGCCWRIHGTHKKNGSDLFPDWGQLGGVIT